METGILHLHKTLAYILVIYAFVSVWLDLRLKKAQPMTPDIYRAHKQYALTVKIMQYVTIAALLTGLFRLYTWLQVLEQGDLPHRLIYWAYAKVFLFIPLTGIMGALGSIPLKRRMHAYDSGGLTSDLQISTGKKLELFKYFQLLLIVAMFGIGTYKPGGPTKIEPAGATDMEQPTTPGTASEEPGGTDPAGANDSGEEQ